MTIFVAVNSLVEENYLKALFNLSGETDSVNVNELSRHLNIKMPTVTSMMKKLCAKELVIYESYKPVRLTDLGKKTAASIIRKHRLTEMFLVEKMGFGWEEVHDIAEQIEHIQSVAFFEKMDELLGYPKFDPHGSPIPDKDGQIDWKNYFKLSDCSVGDHLLIGAVINNSSEFLHYLNGKQLRLGLKLTIESIESFDKSMVISYENHPHTTLSHEVCERILVEKFN